MLSPRALYTTLAFGDHIQDDVVLDWLKEWATFQKQAHGWDSHPLAPVHAGQDTSCWHFYWILIPVYVVCHLTNNSFHLDGKW